MTKTTFKGDLDAEPFKADIERLYWIAIKTLTARTVAEALKG